MEGNHSGTVGGTQDYDVKSFAADVSYNMGSTVPATDILMWLDSLKVSTMRDLYQIIGLIDMWDLCLTMSGKPKLSCQVNVRASAKAWAVQNYQPTPFNLCPTCQQRDIECGNVPPDDKCPNETKCGSCGANLTCIDGKCVAPPCVPQTCSNAGAECGKIPDGCGGTVDCGKCPRGKVCGMGGPNKCGVVQRKRIVAPWQRYDAGGFQIKPFESCVAEMDATMPESDKMSACSLLLDPNTSYEDLVEYAAELEKNKFPNAAKKFKDAAALKKPAEKYPPPPAETSNTLAWVLGSIGAVVAVGAVAYFATRKPGRVGSNPAKMSGYKSFGPALKHAVALARELDKIHYVAVRSDGFHLDTAKPRSEWDDEYVLVKPDGTAERWARSEGTWKKLRVLNA